ncbi:pentatricopeptide repeat (PPR) superfamily protein [Wolffia australiana]
MRWALAGRVRRRCPLSRGVGGGGGPALEHGAVLATISSYGNDWARAVEFFRWAEAQGFKHSRETYNGLIDVLGKFFEFDEAWRLVAEMRTPDHATFRVLFNRYAAAHLVGDALAAFDRAADFGLRDRATFHHLVDALCDHRHVLDAEELFLKDNKKPPFPADTKVHNMVLQGWSRLGWWSRCRLFWREMDERGVAKDLHSYSIFMAALSKAGKPWLAVKLYREMKSKGMPLDAVAYNTALLAAGRSGGADQAARVYREMQDRGCRPNAATHNAMIKLLCAEGRLAEALAFLDRMNRLGCPPTALSYHSLFRCLSRPREILRLFDRMVAGGCRPTMETFVLLMRKFGRWGFLRPVFFFWRAMADTGMSPDGFAYNALIDALLLKGMVELARHYDGEMLDKGLSAKPRKEFGPRFGSPPVEDDACSHYLVGKKK